jgi:hypothetical protein
MNLRKMIFWRIPANQLADGASPSNTSAALVTPTTQPEAINNVISLQPLTTLDAPPGLDAPLTGSPGAPVTASSKARGLLCTPVLQAFFADNHFGLGRHNGANYRTQEALELGKHALVSRFQNTLAELVEQKQAKADRLHDTLMETEGFCNITTARLRQARINLEREMALLRAQVDSASEGKGWVLDALNQYQIGFGSGLCEAVEFELLAD